MFAFGILMFLSSAFQIFNAYEARYGFLINSGLVLFIAFFAFIIILSLLSIWLSVALTKAVADILENKPNQDWKTTFRSISPVVWPAIYTSLLAGIIIFGGTLLFIIPGIIFSVWYMFSTYAVILDGKKGREALRMSKSLVTGRWWRILWRAAAPALLFGFVAYLIILAALVPLNWSSFSASLNSATTPVPTNLYSTSSDQLEHLFSSVDQLPSPGLTIINNLITSIVYMLLIPLSTTAILMLYMSAKENPIQLPPSNPPSL